MGTGSVENLVLKWLRHLPTVPVPIFGRAIGKHREKGEQEIRQWAQNMPYESHDACVSC